MPHSDEIGVLFLSRTFPPSTGGMQKFSYELMRHLKTDEDVFSTALTWGGPTLWLPFVIPYLCIRAVIHLLQEEYDIIYGTDGVVSLPVLLLGALFRTNTCITLHGLDITYDSFLYQMCVAPTFDWHDHVICVSRATADAAEKAGVNPSKIDVVPNGVEPDEYYREGVKHEILENRFPSLNLEGKTVLLSVGRIVERKGFHWFVSEVMPDLGDEYIYIICGTGPMEEHILELREKKALTQQVHLLGHVSEEALATLYNTADTLVMPNIAVDGDMEGFGLVALEASSCGTPVVAADIEGLQNSVIKGQNGTRAESENVDAFIEGIGRVLDLDADTIRRFTVEVFSWERQEKLYKDIFRRNISDNKY